MSKTHGKDQEYIDNNFSTNDPANMKQSLPNNGPPQVPQQQQQQHYFDAKKNTQVLPCQFCEVTFVRKNDLVIHLENIHHLPMHLVTGSQPVPDDNEMPPAITINPIKRKSSSDSDDAGESASKRRRPGPASRTNAPTENRVKSSNIPLHLLEAQLEESANGYKCPECDKVLQHKQSYLSHLKVIHGNFFGSNKWKGSSVVDFILEQSRTSPRKKSRGGGPDANATQCTLCEAVFPNPSSLRNHVVNVHVNGSSFTCQLCGKAFLNEENLEAHTKSKHPNLTKRLQALREALGIAEGDTDGILQPPDINANTLPSNAVLSSLSKELVPSSLSLSMSDSNHDASPATAVEYPLNLSTTSNSDDHKDSCGGGDSPPSPSCPSTPTRTTTQPAPASSAVPPPPVDLPSTPVPAKDLADVAKLPLPPPPPLPSSPVPISDIVVQVNNNNAGEGGGDDGDDDDEGEGASGSGGGGRKKNSICKVCGIVLSPKTNVNVHMRTHSGARPYQCALCLSRFRQKAHLMKHFRCSHNMKRPPFVCLFCSEETATSNDLYRHITDRHKADTDQLVKAKGIQAPPEADEVDEHLQPIKPSRAQQQMLQKQAQLVTASANAAAAGGADVPEFPSLTTRQPEPPLPQHPESPQPLQEAEIPQQVILPQQPLPLPMAMPIVQPVAVPPAVQEAAPPEASPEGSRRGNSEPGTPDEDEDDVRYEPITEPFLFEGQVIYPCYCILPFINDAEVEASCRRSITVSAAIQCSTGVSQVGRSMGFARNATPLPCSAFSSVCSNLQ